MQTGSDLLSACIILVEKSVISPSSSLHEHSMQIRICQKLLTVLVPKGVIEPQDQDSPEEGQNRSFIERHQVLVTAGTST